MPLSLESVLVIGINTSNIYKLSMNTVCCHKIATFKDQQEQDFGASSMLYLYCISIPQVI